MGYNPKRSSAAVASLAAQVLQDDSSSLSSPGAKPQKTKPAGMGKRDRPKAPQILPLSLTHKTRLSTTREGMRFQAGGQSPERPLKDPLCRSDRQSFKALGCLPRVHAWPGSHPHCIPKCAFCFRRSVPSRICRTIRSKRHRKDSHHASGSLSSWPES